MDQSLKHLHGIITDGFAIIPDIYSAVEIEKMIGVLNDVDTSNSTFRKTEDLFAIRQFLKEVPDIIDVVFNQNLKNIIDLLFGIGYFVTKSIYFDKPEKSNWFVAWHQDLTISVNKRLALPGYGPWTVKQDQFAVQPPLNILQENFTIRIHLDDTDKENGALKVIPQSHLKGVYRIGEVNWEVEKETICEVKMGGIMIMKPMLLHASNRTTNNQKRRVIHIEFSKAQLPPELTWSEKLAVNS